MKERFNETKAFVLLVALMSLLPTSCKKDSISLSSRDLACDFRGSETSIDVTSNISWEVASNAEWCVIQNSIGEKNGSFKVIVALNESVEDRMANVLITDGKNLRDSLVVTQRGITASDDNFYFEPRNQVFNAISETMKVELAAVGEWSLDPVSKPGWVKVSPTSGKGNAVIEISVDKNGLLLTRKSSLLFSNKLTGGNALLKIEQLPMELEGVSDYKYLGAGYNAAGEYANDKEVGARILDWNKLVDKGYIAENLIPKATDERNIYSKTIQGYQEKLGVEAGLSASYRAFSASVNSTFQKEAIESLENEFASFNHYTQKVIIKLNENITTKDLRDCMTNEAMEDINNSNMSTISILRKYGTHVVSGFVLGGVLSYSMTADMTSSSSSVDWSLAVKAGYQSIIGGVEASGSVAEYNKITKFGVNKEEKLIARGGESQYTSMRGKDMYNKWLTSLRLPKNWVMINFAGSKLLPLWELARDTKRQNELKKATEDWLKGNLPAQKSTHKMFSIDFVKARYTGYAPGLSRDLDTTFKNGTVKVNGLSSSTFIKDFMLILPDKDDRKNPRGFRYTRDFERGSLGQGNGRSYQYSLSMREKNRVNVYFEVKGDQTNQTKAIGFDLEYDPATDTWKRMGTNNVYSNGSTIELSTYMSKGEGNVEVVLELNWK